MERVQEEGITSIECRHERVSGLSGQDLENVVELTTATHRCSERRGTDGAQPRDRGTGDVARTVPSEEFAFDLAQPRLWIEYLPAKLVARIASAPSCKYLSVHG